MHCNFIPDHVLKHLKDEASLKISKDIRGVRNRVKRFFVKMLAPAKVQHEHRITYDCKNGTDLPGTLIATDNSPISIQDGIAAKAHAGADAVYRFYWTLFGRDSIDDKGMAFKSSVHYDKDYNNAFWTGGGSDGQMVYGDSDYKFFVPLVNGVDVLGHEAQHGVTESIAGLLYYEEMGALNESISDVFGITLKQYLAGQSNPLTANWMLGQDIVGPEFPGKCLRTFTLDKAYSGDNQSSYYKDKVWTFQDNFGVHTNSKIPSRVFYLFCVNTSYSSYEQPIQIWYNALHKCNQFTRFKSFAKILIQTTTEMYGKDSKETQVMTASCKKVGIA